MFHRTEINESVSIFFIAPGRLEVPNERGGGIEQNIFNLAKHLPVPSIIFSPRPHQVISVPIKTHRTQIIYSLIPSVKTYPTPPYFCFSNIHNYYFMSILFSIDAVLRVLIYNKKIDTVIIFDKFSGILPLIIAYLTKKKRVYMEYNIWPWTYNGHYRSLFFKINVAFGKIVSKISSIITVNSPSIKIGMILNGIDPSKMLLFIWRKFIVKLPLKRLRDVSETLLFNTYMGHVV